MIVFGVLIGILMVWAKIFRFGIRLPIYPELSPFAPPLALEVEPFLGQLGNFSSSVGDQCAAFSFSTLVKYGGVKRQGGGDMSAAPRKHREKAASEAKNDDTAAAKDDGGGAKQRRRHRGQKRKWAKKAKKEEEKAKKAEDIPKHEDEPLCKQESSVTLKPVKPRPNVFLALRLTNPEIQSNVRRFQESFLADNPKLGRLCVPVQKSHVSLQVNVNKLSCTCWNTFL